MTALHRAFGLRFYLAGLLKLMYDISELSSPLFIKWIIQYMQDESQPIYKGYILCAAMLLVQMFALFAIQTYFHVVMTQGLRVKTALRAAVYQKALRLSSQARQKMNTGDITNYMSIDSAKIGDLLTYLHTVRVFYSQAKIFVTHTNFFLLRLGVLLSKFLFPYFSYSNYWVGVHSLVSL